MINEIMEIVRVGLLRFFGMLCLSVLIFTFGAVIFRIIGVVFSIFEDFFKGDSNG